MAHQNLLDCVNAVLRRVGLISGDDSATATLTGSSKQRAIDIAIQVINEGIDELYSTVNVSHPKQQAESTLTLVDGTRSYDLATDLVTMIWPMIDKTNNQYLHFYPGGYNALLVFDPEQDDTGLPYYAAISPVDGKLLLDRAPTSVEAGRIYTYQYKRDLVLEQPSDLVPFNHVIFNAMVPAWAQLWRRDQQREFDKDAYDMSLGRAARLLTQMPARDSYCPRGSAHYSQGWRRDRW